MAYIALSEFTIAGPAVAHPWKLIAQQRARQLEKLVQGSTFAYRDVINCIQRFRRVGNGGEQIRLHGVFDIAEVAARFPVAIDVNRLASDELRNPPGNDRSIGPIRVLP